CGVVITKASSTSSSLYSSVGGAIFGRMGSGSMHGGSSLHSKSESGYNSNSTSTSAAASVGGTGGGGSNHGQANATAANYVSVLKPAGVKSRTQVLSLPAHRSPLLITAGINLGTPRQLQHRH
ncbi:MAG: hypothetical protein ACREBR_04020, partial [bacterium]